MPLIPQTKGAFRPPTVRAPAVKPPKVTAPKQKPLDPYKVIDQAVGRLGTPQTDAQIQASAQGQLSPIIAALTAQLQRQQEAGGAAIQGYTNSLAQSLAPFAQSAGNIYSGAEQAQAALDAALAQRLSGGGSDQAQQLGARLASINAPGATNAAVEGATNTAAGAGNASYARGSASLADLIARGAAAQNYAAAQPGIARLSGLQQLGQLTSSLQGKYADQVGQLQAKIPDIVNNLQSQRSDLLGRQETLRQTLIDRQNTQDYRKQQQAATSAYRKATLGLSSRREAYNEWLQQKKLGQADAKTSFDQWYKQQQLGQGAARIAISRANLTLAQQKRAAATQAKLDSGGYSKAALTSFAKRAQKIAEDAFRGKPSVGYVTSKPDANGNTHEIPQHGTTHLSYQEAMTDGLAAKIPLTIMQDALNSYWTKPGYDRDFVKGVWVKSGKGRPVQSYQERNPGKDAASARTPAGAKAAAFQIAQSRYGWGGNELAALEQLWNGESGWNYLAVNRSSGAAGIPQALGHKLPADYASNPVSQINWGLNYIRQRYGTPSRALAFWQANSPHWY